MASFPELFDSLDPEDPEWTGSFKEGKLVFVGTRAEDDGLTTATFEMALSEDAMQMVGDESWSWDWTSRADVGTCTEGKSTVTATRSP